MEERRERGRERREEIGGGFLFSNDFHLCFTTYLGKVFREGTRFWVCARANCPPPPRQKKTQRALCTFYTEGTRTKKKGIAIPARFKNVLVPGQGI